MQVSVEESGVIERKITISVPCEQIDSEVTKRLKNVARTARIPGFRPGKAPESVIKKRYEPQVTHEVVSETINSSYMDALGQEKIVPAGLIAIDPTPYEPGQDLQYIATIELFPQIPCPTLEGKTIDKPVVEVKDEDVDKTLEDIRKRNANYVADDGQSQKGDRLTIDFDGTIDGESFEGGSASDFQFILGEGQMLKEFDDGLLGCSVEQETTISFTFPQDYGSEEVAGKDVSFTVKVKAVEKPELAELDDSFAESLGVEEGGINKLREEIGKNLNRELASRLRTVIRDRVMDALYESNSIQTPKALVEEEIDRSVQAVTEQLAQQGLPTDKIDRELYAKEAEKRVALGLIAREIIEKFEIKSDREAIRAHVEEMSQDYEDSQTYVDWHMADPQRVKHIEAMVFEEQIVEKMLETAMVNEQTLSFGQFMNPEDGS